MKKREHDHSKYRDWIDPNQADKLFKENGEGNQWAVYIHIFPNSKIYIGITSQIP